MFKEFTGINLYAVNEADIIVNLFVALICSFVIAFVYRKTYNGPAYTPSFLNSIILLAMITALVIMVIGNNLARAFGLVGAMSIIRFRTAIKDTMDIVYVFFALAVGMASGVGYYLIAFSGTIVISIVLYTLSVTKFSHPRRREHLLQFFYKGQPDAEPPYMDLLKKYCSRYNMVNVKSLDELDWMELSFYIKLRKDHQGTEFSRELNKLEGVKSINLYYDDEHF